MLTETKHLNQTFLYPEVHDWQIDLGRLHLDGIVALHGVRLFHDLSNETTVKERERKGCGGGGG